MLKQASCPCAVLITPQRHNATNTKFSNHVVEVRIVTQNDGHLVTRGVPPAQGQRVIGHQRRRLFGKFDKSSCVVFVGCLIWGSQQVSPQLVCPCSEERQFPLRLPATDRRHTKLMRLSLPLSRDPPPTLAPHVSIADSSDRLYCGCARSTLPTGGVSPPCASGCPTPSLGSLAPHPRLAR